MWRCAAPLMMARFAVVLVASGQSPRLWLTAAASGCKGRSRCYTWDQSSPFGWYTRVVSALCRRSCAVIAARSNIAVDSHPMGQRFQHWRVCRPFGRSEHEACSCGCRSKQPYKCSDFSAGPRARRNSSLLASVGRTRDHHWRSHPPLAAPHEHSVSNRVLHRACRSEIPLIQC